MHHRCGEAGGYLPRSGPINPRSVTSATSHKGENGPPTASGRDLERRDDQTPEERVFRAVLDGGACGDTCISRPVARNLHRNWQRIWMRFGTQRFRILRRHRYESRGLHVHVLWRLQLRMVVLVPPSMALTRGDGVSQHGLGPSRARSQLGGLSHHFVCALALMLPLTGRAQATLIDATAAFEVVSIREARGDGPFSARESPTRVTFRNVTIAQVISWAFELGENDIADGPRWIHSRRFDIDGSTGDVTRNRAELREMVKTLLVQRLKLQATFEPSDRPVYALVNVRINSKANTALKQSTTDCRRRNLAETPFPEQGLIRKLTISSSECGVVPLTDAAGIAMIVSFRGTMKDLAQVLSRYGKFDRQVIDRTDLHGEYDFTVRRVSARKVDGPSGFEFLESLHDQLGLTLVSQRAVVDILAIRHVQLPTAD